MNEMTEISSTFEKRDAWPVNAVPQAWVEKLFDKMNSVYGDRFPMMWRATKLDRVKEEWGIALFKLSRGQIEAGVDTLVNLVKCPTLPEFVAHCKAARLERAANTAPLLASSVKADPAVVEENLRRIKAACRASVSRFGTEKEA